MKTSFVFEEPATVRVDGRAIGVATSITFADSTPRRPAWLDAARSFGKRVVTIMTPDMWDDVKLVMYGRGAGGGGGRPPDAGEREPHNRRERRHGVRR